MQPKTINHYSLTTKQLAILNLLYRFRFATSEQLSQALIITKATTNKRLKLLLELKYIDRKYNRISREHAIYYLSPEGTNQLKKMSKQKYLVKVLRNIRHDSEASNQFMKHCLGVFDVYLAFRVTYGDNLQFFTKTQMAPVPYFPKQLPDAHIQLGAKNRKLFLLDLLHSDQPFFLATRAVIRYIDYAEKDMWPSQFEFPKILLVCDNAALQKRLLKKMRYRIENLENPALKFYITTVERLRTEEWYDMADPDRSLSLNQI